MSDATPSILAAPLFPRQIDWEHILSVRRQHVDAAALACADAERASVHLRSLFGEDVMALPLPVLERLLNFAPWTYRWLCWLSDAMRRVEAASGYAGLCDRLRDSLKFDEACSVLQVAERLAAVGLRVSFDVPAQVGSAMKVPDVFVEDETESVTFHCEVSVMYSAKAQADQWRICHRIVHSLLFQIDAERFLFCGRLLRPVADSEIEGLIGRIRWEMMEVRKDRALRLFDVEDSLRLALAPTERESELQSWALEQGLGVNSFAGVPIAADRAVRLRNKIEDKARQLPAGSPNIVVVPAQDLFVASGDVNHLMTHAVEVISGFGNVAILVLTSEDIGRVIPGVTRLGDHILAISDRDGLSHQHLVIKNPNSAVELPKCVVDKVRLAFSL